MTNVYDVLVKRGYIEQATHEDEIREILEKEKVTFYIGFDPTADSLTAGHFLTVMAMSHLQKAGHIPIALVGGGTGIVGDPSDRTDMRKMMTKQTIENNVAKFKEQLSKFIDFSDNKAFLINNEEWLTKLNYIDFIKDIGIHFSVNKMLSAECFKKRMEKGLSFFEFNYMLMQSYDFLELNKKYNCKLQLGGSDQWSNIIGGVELIRKVEKKQAYGLTFKLLTTSDGIKMGKTQKGAVWLDKEKTSPYEFYQYWRNVADTDVEKCLSLLTFLELDEIQKLTKVEGSQINKAKEVLAYEVTKIVHGQEEAQKAQDASKALFAGGNLAGSIPTTKLEKSLLENGINILELLVKLNLCPSKSEARRLVQQGGIKVNEEKIESIDHMINMQSFKDEIILIQKGKKIFHKIEI